MSEVPPPPPSYSNYPRTGYTNFGGRPPGVYFETIGESWKLVSQNMGMWVACSLIGMVIYLATSVPLFAYYFATIIPKALAGDQEFHLDQQLVVMVLSMLPSMSSYMVFTSMAHMAVQQQRGYGIALGDFFNVFRRLGPLLGASAIYALAITLGTYLCILPGFFAAGSLAFTMLIAVDQGVGPVEAAKRSFAALKPHAWIMALFLLVLYMIWSVGTLCCFVGVLFTTPLAAIAIGLHYTYFFPPATDPQYVAPY